MLCCISYFAGGHHHYLFFLCKQCRWPQGGGFSCLRPVGALHQTCQGIFHLAQGDELDSFCVRVSRSHLCVCAGDPPPEGQKTDPLPQGITTRYVSASLDWATCARTNGCLTSRWHTAACSWCSDRETGGTFTRSVWPFPLNQSLKIGNKNGLGTKATERIGMLCSAVLSVSCQTVPLWLGLLPRQTQCLSAYIMFQGFWDVESKLFNFTKLLCKI